MKLENKLKTNSGVKKIVPLILCKHPPIKLFTTVLKLTRQKTKCLEQ